MRDLAQASTVGSLNVLCVRQRVRGVALRTGLDGLTADPLPSLSAYRAFPTPVSVRWPRLALVRRRYHMLPVHKPASP
jgi:hypothetical protein